MTIKTLTVSILLATSFLLLTGCGDKNVSEVTSEQNTIVQTDTDIAETDNGITSDGNGNDNNLTGGSSDGDENTIIPTTTVAPISLTLTIEKTSLNKDENTSLKVMATYSGRTSNEVTDKVEWVVTPKESVSISNSMLKALRDTQTSIQAKLDTKLSEKVNLNIIWIVNGHTLPPEPDKAVNDATLFGVDVNGNDVRDDVERWIYETYKDKHPIYIDIAMQAGRAYKKVLETPEKAKEIREVVNAPMNCGLYYQYNAKYLNEPILLNERIDTKIFSKMFNTKERNDVYWEYDKLLSGGVYDALRSAELKAQCDFNTSQYKE